MGETASFSIYLGDESNNFMTTFCYDTGAGANVLNTTFFENSSLIPIETKEFLKPIPIEVGNSDITNVNKAVKLRISFKNKQADIWFLLIDSLPLKAIIGYVTADRLEIIPKPPRKMYWEELELPKSRTLMGMYYSKLSPFDKKKPFIELFPIHKIKLKARHMTRVKICPQEKIPGIIAYMNPICRPTSPLFLAPGLINFPEKKPAEVVIINHNDYDFTLTPKEPVANAFFLSPDDVEQTELINLSENSMLPSKQTYVKLNLLKKRLKQKQHEHTDPALSSTDYSDRVASLLTLNSLKEKISQKANDIPSELEDIFTHFDLEKSDLTQNQKIQIAKLLKEFNDIWSIGPDKPKISHAPSTTCQIKTTVDKPIRSKGFKTNPVEDYIIEKHIKEMADRGVIRPSNSPWASPILLADKKNGKIRFCIDYRRLNAVTIQDAYPLPDMSVVLSLLGSSSYFSTIDLTDAFWSIRVAEEDIEKTAFISRHGLWEFISMPFGLTNAPATQQRFIESVLNGLIMQCCFAYIDDVLCFSTDFTKHINDLKNIFRRFKQNNLKIQPPKCKFCHPTFEILGYVATKDGIKPSSKKVEAMKNYPYPTTVKEAQSFLGIVSWLRRFIPNCSSLTKQIRKCITNKPKNFILSDEAKRQVDHLKTIITSNSCVAHPDFKKQFYIHVDASKDGIGAMLTQQDNENRHRVIEYASKSLSSTQSLESNTIREALGVIWSLEHFKYYVQERQPVVYCDCKSLSQIVKPTSSIPTVAALRNWNARVMHYRPIIIHRPGTTMVIPDALSRNFLKIKILPEFEKKNDNNNIMHQNDVLCSMIHRALDNEHEQNELNCMKAQTSILQAWPAQDVDEFDTREVRTMCPLRPQRNAANRANRLITKHASELNDTADLIQSVKLNDPNDMSDFEVTSACFPVADDSDEPMHNDENSSCLPSSDSDSVCQHSSDISDSMNPEEDLSSVAPASDDNEDIEMDPTNLNATEDNENEPLNYLAREQRYDPQLLEIINFIQSGQEPQNRTHARFLKNIIHQYIIDEFNILRKIDIPLYEEDSIPPAMLPKHLWESTVKVLHEIPSSGHRKNDKLIDLMRKKYYFHGMAAFVKSYCDTCHICQTSTVSKRPTAPLHPHVNYYPGVTVHLDCTHGPHTNRDNSYILAIIDAFSGHVRLYPIPDLTAATVAKNLISYIMVHSMPLRIITDNGPEFANQLIVELAYLLGLKQVKTSPYNSKSNGKVENIHKIVQTMLRAFTEEYSNEWDLLLPMIEFAINTSKSSATKYTPFFIHFGRHPNMPIDFFYGSEYKPSISVNNYVNKLQNQREQILDWVYNFKCKNAQKMIDDASKRYREQTSKLEIGDYCRIRNEQRRGDYGQKYNDIYSRYIYVVLDDHENGSYTIQSLDREEKPTTRHIKSLKKINMKHEIMCRPDTSTITVGKHKVTVPKSFDFAADPTATKNDKEYEVKEILGKRIVNDEEEFLLKWNHAVLTMPEWRNKNELKNCEELINQFLAKQITKEK